MARHEFITGRNFSGRSQQLLARARQFGRDTYFIGPYAEAALSGLSSTVADEIAIYQAKGPTEHRPSFGHIAADPKRKPQSLSGGEQVLLALHCFSISAYRTVAIDNALEQLDPRNRGEALAFLNDTTFDAVLTDNRARPADWTCSELPSTNAAFACDWDRLRADILPRRTPVIAVKQLSFSYRAGADIFRDAEVTLEPGQAHRLSGPNGAGKTTFLKILVGALVPRSAQVSLDGERYEPWRRGNHVLALATQNPDQQWCGATLHEDMARRRAALADHDRKAALAEARVAAIARHLGVASIDQHLYELPLAARKRISWLWPFVGAHPWIMLDEPTIGQDDETCRALARTLTELCAAGYGVMFVTHDDAFAAALPHRVLRVENRQIS
jgi:energy-coupling factor transporter ATP-binding protein EcfA2